MNYKILQINKEMISEICLLEKEADLSGFRFVGRTREEFLNGKNDFSKEGEVLLGAYGKNGCLGICGLNIDPYTEKSGIGRIRHLYIAEQVRNKGIATALVNAVIQKARESFDILRLKSTSEAMKFYDNIGFKRHEGDHESHRMNLRKDS